MKNENCQLGYVPGTTVCQTGECIRCGWNPRVTAARKAYIREMFRQKLLPRRTEKTLEAMG